MRVGGRVEEQEERGGGGQEGKGREGDKRGRKWRETGGGQGEGGEAGREGEGVGQGGKMCTRYVQLYALILKC